MTDNQLWIAVGIPTLAVLVGILLNQVGLVRLEARLNVIEGDLRRFFQMLGQLLGQHDEALSIAKKKLDL
jgi:hypothetical protein